MTDKQHTQPKHINNPFETKESNELNQATYAKNFTELVLKYDISDSLVVGLFGPWDSKRASFVNAVQKNFKRYSKNVISFNPQEYSDTNMLARDFFAGVSKEIERVSSGGEYLSPETVDLVAKYARSLTGIHEKRTKDYIADSSDELRRLIDKEFAKLENPFIVIIDEIDRLQDFEIVTIFKLVRLVANFPNTIYILVCDRPRIGGVFERGDWSGRDHIETIVQVSFDLPATL